MKIICIARNYAAHAEELDRQVGGGTPCPPEPTWFLKPDTALLGIPEVVVYRTLWFQVRLRPYVLKVPWVSLVNLNLGREAVAEVIQSDLDTTRAERELRAIVAGGEKRGRMLADFAELRTVIGGPGASDRFAARMVAELRAPETK